MPRGGARPNSGPKKKIIPEIPKGEIEGKRKSTLLLEALNRPGKQNDSYEVKQWRRLTEAKDINVRGRFRWLLFEHSEGRSVHTVNHLHDKPIEMNVNLSIAEVVRKVRERKEEYERSR